MFEKMLSQCDLVFNIVECLLVGRIGKVEISATAVAGGRAGSKSKGVVDFVLANNPFATGVKKQGKKPGGPLPLGRYKLVPHEKKANWIRLVPLAGTNLNGRAGFAIHGRGSRGSDGCIVPTDFHNVLLIYKLVKALSDSGQPSPTLEVIAAGDLDRWQSPRGEGHAVPV
jgi:hypothetical protein